MELYSDLEIKYDFYKRHPSDKMYWLDVTNAVGLHLFTFDKEVIFNLFADYPYRLSPEQIAIFDKENPFGADFFKDRREELEDIRANSSQGDPYVWDCKNICDDCINRLEFGLCDVVTDVVEQTRICCRNQCELYIQRAEVKLH